MATPQKLGEILPQALINIRNRCNGYRQENGLPLLREPYEVEAAEAGELQEILAVSN